MGQRASRTYNETDESVMEELLTVLYSSLPRLRINALMDKINPDSSDFNRINYITKEYMTSPAMSGVDHLGRRFIAIKGIAKLEGNDSSIPFFQVFYRIHKPSKVF